MRSWLFAIAVSVGYCLCLVPLQTTQVPRSSSGVTTMNAPKSSPEIVSNIYHLNVTIVNDYRKKVMIITAFPGRAHQRFVIPVGGRYPIKSTFPARQQIVVTAYDAETFIPVMIDGKRAVFVFSSITPVSLVYYISSARTHSISTQVPFDVLSTKAATDAAKTKVPTDVATTEASKSSTGIAYYLDVTIVNRYGKKVMIVTNLPDRALHRFVIPIGGKYPIKLTFFTPKQIFITAYDAATFMPIGINGKNTVFVSSRVTPVSRVYHVPSAPTDATSSTQPPTHSVSTRVPTVAVMTQDSTDNLKTRGSTDLVTTESPSSSTTEIVIIYHLDLTIVNHYGKNVIIVVTFPGRAPQRFVILVGQSYPIKSTFSTSQQIVITAYDATTYHPVMTNGKNAVFISPSVISVRIIYYIPSAPTNAGASTQLPTHSVSTQGATGAASTQVKTDVVSTKSPTSTNKVGINYHLEVTIVNRYQKNVVMLMTVPGRGHQRFVIPVCGRYPIKSTPSIRQQIVITAFDAETFTPVMINGTRAIFVFPSVTPASRVYYITSESPSEAVSDFCLTYTEITQAPTDVSATTETPTSRSGIADIYHQSITLMKNFKYGSEIRISRRGTYTIENDSFNPVKIKTKDPSVFVNNAPFSKLLKQLNEKLRK